jgi:hypothetical protein
LPLVIAAAAVLLRLVFAVNRGLVLDEFHSLHHASRPDLGAFFDGLLRDNHPPLSFLLLGAVRRVLGDAALALRAPALLFGGLNVLLAARLARRIPWPGAPAVAAAVLAVSSLHLDIGGQARMYALHALCVTGMLEALLSFLETPQGRRPLEAGVQLVFWCVLGLHNHYYFLHYLLLAGAGVVLAALLAPHSRRRVVHLVPVAAVIALLFLPWFLRGFLVQLSHRVPPGMTRVGPEQIGEALVHLLFLDVSAGGAALRSVFIAGGVLAVALAGLGFARLWVERVVPAGVDAPVQLALAAVGVPVWAGLIAWIDPQAGYNWMYLAPSAPALAVLVAAAMGPGRLRFPRHAAVAAVVSSAALLCVLVAVTPGREDYRGAIAHVLREAGPADAVAPVEYQPNVFPQGLAWEYYSRRLGDDAPLPERLAVHQVHFFLLDPARLKERDGVFVLRRSLPPDAPFWEPLRAEFEETEVRGFGYGLWVHRFERR